MNGDTAVVGALRDNCAAGVDCGAVYVFRFNGTSWVEEQKLTASDAAANDFFGHSVSVSGDTTVVGASGDGCCGSVYVFRFNGTSWVQEQKLTASDAGADDLFGVSVSASGGTILVGALLDDCAAGFNCGSAYVFRFNGTSWVEEQKLTTSDAGAKDRFGESVSLSGETILVGAPEDDCAAGARCGSAYVFRFNGTAWVEEQKLTASDAGAGQAFGISVSVSGETAVVGALFDDCACGSAYVFRFNGNSWVEEQKLAASDAEGSEQFGFSVSVSGQTTVVGALYDGCAVGRNCGSAYVFRFNGNSWVEEQKFIASDAAATDLFGVSVSVNGHTIFVGARFADCATDIICGAAYVFAVDAPCCGDGEFEPGEECDGTDDAKCPGNCMVDCTCEPGTEIPAVSEWGVVIAALLVLAAGTVVLRRRVSARRWA